MLPKGHEGFRVRYYKRRGHGRLGRVDTGLLARTLPSGTKEHANIHGRDALCPSAKIQKHAAFGKDGEFKFEQPVFGFSGVSMSAESLAISGRRPPLQEGHAAPHPKTNLS